jgi:hypothetical protein
MKNLIRGAATTACLLAGVASVQAALIDRGGGLVYDDVLNVTWLQDANYAKTSGYDSDGVMNWFAAMDWADDLSYFDPIRGVTYSDWRLPTTTIQMQGYNQTGSELGSLYYLSLGNTASLYTTKNTGPFTNVFLPGIDWSVFWSSTDGVNSTNQGSYQYAFTFIFNDGNQDRTDPAYFERFAWAVRDGDVAASVPEPSAWALSLVAIAALGLTTRRRRSDAC